MPHTGSRLRLLAAGFSAAVALALGVPGAASAATTTCTGHLEKGQARTELGYAFGCSGPILGYTITFDQEIDGFDAEVPVLKTDGTASNELMSCEGDIPSSGVGCFGTYSAGGEKIRGTVATERPVCADPRYKAWLFVVVGVKGQTAGPFALKGPQGCGTHTTQIDRLLAWIKLLRHERAAKRS